LRLIRAPIEVGADRLVNAGISDVVRWPMVAEEIAFALAYGTAVGRANLSSYPQLGAAIALSRAAMPTAPM
jgi:hypothetical protein